MDCPPRHLPDLATQLLLRSRPVLPWALDPSAGYEIPSEALALHLWRRARERPWWRRLSERLSWGRGRAVRLGLRGDGALSGGVVTP
jgi:hypothetical protein